MSGIMSGHIMVPKIDNVYPASLSKKILSLLRSTGYDNLIITDSLSMVGLTNIFGVENAHKLAFAAGNDMVLSCYRTSTKLSYKWLVEAYEAGMIHEEQINQSVKRILKAQQQTLIFDQTTYSTEEDKKIASQIAQSSIAYKATKEALSYIPPQHKHLFIIQDANYYYNHKINQIVKEEYFNLDSAINTLHKEFPQADFVRIPGYPSKYEIEEILAKSLQYDSVIPVLYSFTASYCGSSDTTQRLLAMLYGLQTKTSAIVLFGNPYAAREYPEVPLTIFGFDEVECQKYAIEALAGKFVPEGKLPVSF
jgi:beta-glucosidase-like glycosyl hydrolase